MTDGWVGRVHDRARRLEREVWALAAALRDPRTPWHARVVLGLTVGLAVSPLDPVPDFIPVLGYLDDLLFIPAGVWASRRLTPDEVLADARERARKDGGGRLGWVVAALVVLGYVALVAVAVAVLLRGS